MTPFKAVYGWDPPGLIPYAPHPSDPPNLQQLMTKRDTIIQQRLIWQMLRLSGRSLLIEREFRWEIPC
jgi:hypothetical protein